MSDPTYRTYCEPNETRMLYTQAEVNDLVERIVAGVVALHTCKSEGHGWGGDLACSRKSLREVVDAIREAAK